MRLRRAASRVSIETPHPSENGFARENRKRREKGKEHSFGWQGGRERERERKTRKHHSWKNICACNRAACQWIKIARKLFDDFDDIKETTATLRDE